ncbi:rhodanese-related sulfurtransferase [Candidatus Pacearchaeota archaeon]|nr:rhodanese-related sulfurtransferase [Candidatus Pacearchaeota archaeon]
MVQIVLFYKYVKIDSPQEFAVKHKEYCKQLGLLGRILVAEEGINGSVSGSKEQIETYRECMIKNPLFSGIQFKEEQGELHPFNRMVVKVKKEIVRFEQEVDLTKTGKHISPQEFLDLYNDKDVLIVDARNEYESRVGKFKNAITASTSNFRDFPAFAESLKDKKDKKIAMYCTGGIRCEKASAYLIQQGFKNVVQLDGGILNFVQQLPNTAWEGKCFVFDKRLMSAGDESSLSLCEGCGIKCDLYKDCRNKTCNKFTSLCSACDRKLAGCCCEECLNEFLASKELNIVVAS